MSLITQPPAWTYFPSNIAGATPADGLGTVVTASGSINTDGTAVELLPALTADLECIVVGTQNFTFATANTASLLDILFDPAGGTAWETIVPDLQVGEGSFMSVAAGPWELPGHWYTFPVFIPKGSTVGALVRSARASEAGNVIIHGMGGNQNPGSFWTGQRVEAVGITAASSRGTAHTPGNSGVYSSWTDFGSPLSAACGALQFGVQSVVTAVNNLLYIIEFGVGGNRIGPPIWRYCNTAERGGNTTLGGNIFCSLPAGAQLQVRGTCNGTAQALEVSAYAVM